MFNNSDERAEAQCEEGRRLLGEKDYVGALACFEEALKLNKNSRGAYHGKAEALRYLGDCEQALKFYPLALTKGPKDVHVYHNQGLALAELGRYQEAINSFNTSLRLSLEPDSSTNYYKGLSCYFLNKQKDHEEAIRSFGGVLETDPNYANACFYTVLSLDALREDEFKKDKQLNEFIQRAPSDAQDLCGKINLLAERKMYSRAFAVYEKARKLLPVDRIDFMVALIPVYAHGTKQGKLTGIDYDEKEAEKSYQEGKRHFNAKSFLEARNCFYKAVELNPKEIKYYFELGNAFFALSQYSEAIVCYDCYKLLLWHFKNSHSSSFHHLICEARIKHAEALFELEWYKAAEKEIRQVVEPRKEIKKAKEAQSEQIIRCLFILAKCEYMNDRVKDALKILNAIDETRLDNGWFFYYKGKCLIDTGDFEGAREYFNQAIGKPEYSDDAKFKDKVDEAYTDLEAKEATHEDAEGLATNNVSMSLEVGQIQSKTTNKEAEAEFIEGEKYSNEGDYGRALQHYKQAIVFDGTVGKYHYDAAEVLYKLSENEKDKSKALDHYIEVIEYYDQAILHAKDGKAKAVAYNAKGWILYTNFDKFKDALDCYEEAIELNKTNHDFYHNQAIALHNQAENENPQENYEKAIVSYNNAIKCAREEKSDYKNKGEADSTLRKYDEAIEFYYENIGEAYFTLRKYDEAIKSYKESQKSSKKLDYSNKLSSAYYALGDYDNARKCYPKKVPTNDKKQFFISLINRAKACIMLDEVEKGRAYLEQAKEVKSITESHLLEQLKQANILLEAATIAHKNIVAKKNLLEGIKLYQDKQYAEARNLFKTARGLDPSEPEYWFYEGEALCHIEGSKDQAIACYEEAERMAGTSTQKAKYILNNGIVHLDHAKTEDEFKAALKLFEEAEGIKPNESPKLVAEIYYFIAEANYGWSKHIKNLALKNTKLTDSSTAYGKAIESIGEDDKFTKAYYYQKQGKAELKLKNYGEAITLFLKAIELNKFHADYYANVADTYLEEGKLEKAIEWNKKAINLDPNDWGYHSNIGNILYLQKKYDEAIAAYKRAVFLDPANEDYKTKLNACAKLLSPEAVVADLHWDETHGITDSSHSASFHESDEEFNGDSSDSDDAFLHELSSSSHSAESDDEDSPDLIDSDGSAATEFRAQKLIWNPAEEAELSKTEPRPNDPMYKALMNSLGFEVFYDNRKIKRDDFLNLTDVFIERVTQDHKSVFIINEMGYGKTMFTKYLFQSQFTNDRKFKSELERLRIYVDLKQLLKEHESNDLLDILAQHLEHKYKPEISISDGTEALEVSDIREMLNNHHSRLMFLFDGLDECTKENQYRFLNALAKYKKQIAFILTSRDIPIIKEVRDEEKTDSFIEAHLEAVAEKAINELGDQVNDFRDFLKTPLFFKAFRRMLDDGELEENSDSFKLKPSVADFYLILFKTSWYNKNPIHGQYDDLSSFIKLLFKQNPDKKIQQIHEAASLCYNEMLENGSESVSANYLPAEFHRDFVEVGWCCYKREERGTAELLWAHPSYKEFLAALHIAQCLQNPANLSTHNAADKLPDYFTGKLKNYEQIIEFTVGILVSYAVQNSDTGFIKFQLAAQLNSILAHNERDDFIKLLLNRLIPNKENTKAKAYKEMIKILHLDTPSAKVFRKVLSPFYWNGQEFLIDIILNPDKGTSQQDIKKEFIKYEFNNKENKLTSSVERSFNPFIKDVFDPTTEDPAGNGRIDLCLKPKKDTHIDTCLIFEFKKGYELEGKVEKNKKIEVNDHSSKKGPKRNGNDKDKTAENNKVVDTTIEIQREKDKQSLLNKAINQALVGRLFSEALAHPDIETDHDPMHVFNEMRSGSQAYQNGYINTVKLESRIKNIIVIGGAYILGAETVKLSRGTTEKPRAYA